VAAAVQQASRPPERQADHHAGGDDVQVAPHGQPLGAQVYQHHRGGQGDPSVVDQSAGGDIEDLQGDVFLVQEIAPVLEDVSKARAHDAPDQRQDSAGSDRVGAFARAAGPPTGQRDPTEESHHQHQPVPEDPQGDASSEKLEGSEIDDDLKHSDPWRPGV